MGWFDENAPAGGAPSAGGGGDWFSQQGPGGGAGGGGDWFTQQGPTGAGGGGPAAGQDPQAYFQSLIQGQPGTPQTLIGLEPQLAQAGIKVLRNAAGTAGKIQLPNGQIVDVIRSAGTGGGAENWQWDLGGAPGGGGGFAGGAGGYDPGYAERMADPGYRYRMGLDGLLETDPGYQFRLQEGQKALERSAAAKGTLLTGGTAKGLARYGQDYASQEFQNRYARLLGEEQMRYGRLFGEQQNRYNQLYGLSNLGLGAAGTQAQLGSAYAGQAGNLLAGQAAGIGDLYTQRGNAAAAGTVGGANAWQQGLGQAANTAQNMAQMYYLSRLYGTQPGQGGTSAYGPYASGYRYGPPAV